jgi:hypothetical protein
MKKLVVVAIPIYKSILTENEKISLKQLNKILGDKYDIVFIAPKSLNFDYGDAYNHFKIERFSDQYFKSTASYSEMLLSVAFYQRFPKYQYMLIYQLDAFVFSDQLEKFCHMKFDYIGAPIPKAFNLWRSIGCRVGNGGFSLRKIDSTIRLLENKDHILGDHPMKKTFNEIEDLFFAFCGTQKEFNFKVAPVSLAMKFSLEHSSLLKKLKTKLPFGCHGWYKSNTYIWKPFIEKYGYKVNIDIENIDNNFKYTRCRYLQKKLSMRIIHKNKSKYFKSILVSLLSFSSTYSIWGNGEDGKRCRQLFELAGVGMDCIYDAKIGNAEIEDGIVLKKPSNDELLARRNIVIVATKQYEAEIVDKLSKLGLKKQDDFILFSELENNIVEEYYNQLRKNI